MLFARSKDLNATATTWTDLSRRRASPLHQSEIINRKPSTNGQLLRPRAYLAFAFTQSSTSAPCASGFTRGHTFATLPSGLRITVERMMPSYTLP